MEWLALSAVVLLVWFLIVVLFSPRIDYRASTPLPLGSPDLLRIVRATCQASVQPCNAVTVLADGVHIYPAMRDAILAAESSINLEAYIYEPGSAADLIGAALADRARAGVEVRVVVDAIGSRKLKGETLARLREAGCKVGFYQPATWYRLHRINNRTHRELLIVDGHVAIVGGAGIADWWWRETDGEPAWRDTSIRIEGPIVAALQGVFAENWLECEGEILSSFEHNDEVNVAFREAAVTARLSEHFTADLARSQEVTLAGWKTRPVGEKLLGPIGWILERQQ